MSQKYYIKTYGCQMNLADSAKLAAVLEENGFLSTPNSKLADLILVNTCVVRQHAEARAAWYVTSLKGLKEKNPNLKIGLCGCLVTEPGRDAKKQFPHVDFFIPPNNADKLAEYIHSSLGTCPEINRGIRHSSLSEENSVGLVTIMHGCDNYCSYCIVPYVRGRETSRPMDEVLAEIKGLIEQGTTDITLLGQNVNSYKYGLANLLRKIGRFVPNNPHPLNPPLHLRWRGGNPSPSLSRTREGVRICFLTSHPRDISDEIIETVAELPYVAKEFLLPLQSGDDEILQKMNRGYTLHYYVERVNKIRSLMPRSRISTDIMVGFPSETEHQFENTLRAVQELNFSEVHMFAYSSRPETAASKLPGQLPKEIKQERLQKLIQVVRKMVK